MTQTGPWGDENRRTAMGDFHPIAWYQEYDGGRSFYTSLGHIADYTRMPGFWSIFMVVFTGQQQVWVKMNRFAIPPQ